MRRNHQILAALVALAVLLTAGAAGAVSGGIKVDASQYPVTEDGVYTSMEEVAVYLTCFDRLPDYFITKKQAQALGWDNRAGNLSDVAPGKSIGGDYFGNYEGNVPDAAGRNWTECDIDSDGGYRNGLRIVFSNDGLIYFSDDHYQSFRRGECDGKCECANARSYGGKPDGQWLNHGEGNHGGWPLCSQG